MASLIRRLNNLSINYDMGFSSVCRCTKQNFQNYYIALYIYIYGCYNISHFYLDDLEILHKLSVFWNGSVVNSSIQLRTVRLLHRFLGVRCNNRDPYVASNKSQFDRIYSEFLDFTVYEVNIYCEPMILGL